MQQPRLIIKEDWSFSLYKRDDQYILSVVCGGAGPYDLNIPISESDARQLQRLRTLAQEVRTNPSRYAAMSVAVTLH
jgi:hypothetical protein